jgi:hypothetical protein
MSRRQLLLNDARVNDIIANQVDYAAQNRPPMNVQPFDQLNDPTILAPNWVASSAPAFNCD